MPGPGPAMPSAPSMPSGGGIEASFGGGMEGLAGPPSVEITAPPLSQSAQLGDSLAGVAPDAAIADLAGVDIPEVAAPIAAEVPYQIPGGTAAERSLARDRSGETAKTIEKNQAALRGQPEGKPTVGDQFPELAARRDELAAAEAASGTTPTGELAETASATTIQQETGTPDNDPTTPAPPDQRARLQTERDQLVRDKMTGQSGTGDQERMREIDATLASLDAEAQSRQAEPSAAETATPTNIGPPQETDAPNGKHGTEGEVTTPAGETPLPPSEAGGPNGPRNPTAEDAASPEPPEGPLQGPKTEEETFSTERPADAQEGETLAQYKERVGIERLGETPPSASTSTEEPAAIEQPSTDAAEEPANEDETAAKTVATDTEQQEDQQAGETAAADEVAEEAVPQISEEEQAFLDTLTPEQRAKYDARSTAGYEIINPTLGFSAKDMAEKNFQDSLSPDQRKTYKGIEVAKSEEQSFQADKPADAKEGETFADYKARKEAPPAAAEAAAEPKMTAEELDAEIKTLQDKKDKTPEERKRLNDLKKERNAESELQKIRDKEESGETLTEDELEKLNNADARARGEAVDKPKTPEELEQESNDALADIFTELSEGRGFDDETGEMTPEMLAKVNRFRQADLERSNRNAGMSYAEAAKQAKSTLERMSNRNNKELALSREIRARLQELTAMEMQMAAVPRQVEQARQEKNKLKKAIDAKEPDVTRGSDEERMQKRLELNSLYTQLAGRKEQIVRLKNSSTILTGQYKETMAYVRRKLGLSGFWGHMGAVMEANMYKAVANTKLNYDSLYDND